MAVLAFDIYGTILDTSAISDALLEFLAISQDQATNLSKEWRKYQLEYTWRLNSMEIYEPFSEVTRKSLVHACADAQITVTEDSTKKLMDAYDRLPTFPDSVSAWKDINAAQGVKTMIFSNGTHDMVSTALTHASLAPYPDAFYLADDAALRVQNGSLPTANPKVFKPAKSIYQNLLQSIDKADDPGDVWLVSCNPFDVTGALAVGMRAIWVDRARAGWADRLLGEQQPTRIVHGLGEIAELAKSL